MEWREYIVPEGEWPFTFHVSVEKACRRLDYADMVALAGLFRRWALYEAKARPEDRTRLIQWSADYEHIAEWVGDDWVASDPPPDPDIIGFLAGLERSWSNVIDFEAAKAVLRPELSNARPGSNG